MIAINIDQFITEAVFFGGGVRLAIRHQYSKAINHNDHEDSKWAIGSTFL